MTKRSSRTTWQRAGLQDNSRRSLRSGGWVMERKLRTEKEGDLRDRATRWLTDRRRFLAGAGKYGAWLMRAAYAIDAADAAGRPPSDRRNSKHSHTRTPQRG